MWRKKSFIIVAIISVVVIAGVLGGFAMASADDQTTTTTPGTIPPNISTLLDKVATVYQEKTGQTLDTQALIDSFQEVQKDMRSEALDNYLDKLVEQNKITSEQAQQYKDWINARPDVPVGPGMGPGMGERFFGKFGGRFGGGMFRGWCGPGNGNGSTTTTPNQ